MGCIPTKDLTVTVKTNTEKKEGTEAKEEVQTDTKKEVKETVLADGTVVREEVVTKTETVTQKQEVQSEAPASGQAAFSVNVNAGAKQERRQEEVVVEKQNMEVVQQKNVEVREEVVVTKEVHKEVVVEQEVVVEKQEVVQVEYEVEVQGEVDVEYKLEEVESGEAYGFNITAWYMSQGEKTMMTLESLELGANGKIRIKGEDTVGRFAMKGRFKPDGRVCIKKQYIGKHTVTYKGKYEKGKIEGDWTIHSKKGDVTDKFGIEFNLPIVYELSDTNLRLSGTTPAVGILVDESGLAIVTALSAEVQPKKFKLLYADGKEEDTEVAWDEASITLKESMVLLKVSM